MPANSQNPLFPKNPRFRRPNFRIPGLVALVLVFPLFLYGQDPANGQNLTGLWVGIVSNDSTTVRKDQSYEIALTEYKNKVYGYSRSEFIVNDTLYYIVKRVKGTIDGDICQVTDDEIVSYNFPGKLDKGIKVTSTFKRNKTDSSWYLDGTWKTNATKKYYAISGKVNLDEEKDLGSSKLFPHLEELKLANEVAFYKERVEGAPIVKLAKPGKIKTEYFSANFLAEETPAPVVKLNQLPRAEVKETKPIEKKEEIVAVNTPVTKDNNLKEPVKSSEETETSPFANVKPVQKSGMDLPKTEVNEPAATKVSVKPATVNKTIAKNPTPETTKPATVVSTKPPQPVTTVVRSTPQPDKPKQQQTPVIAKQELPKTNEPVTKPATTVAVVKDQKPEGIVKTNTTGKPSDMVTPTITETKKPTVDITSLAATIGGRKSEFTQMVQFRSDSIKLSLYDNGEIDGDTVSVYMNGQVILSQQGLKSTALRKTIYLEPGDEEFTLVLYAENLGKYPPNTGLLVVHDGEDVYNLRFSSDLQKNAGIIFKRKK